MALNTLKNFTSTLIKQYNASLIVPLDKLHTCTANFAWKNQSYKTPSGFLSYNEKVYPPQGPDEEPRPAFVCHQRANIKYSPKKMWYIASFIRGMPVDEAIKQLKFLSKKAAKDVREVLEEAKELAVKEHNVEFPSNMWVAESFCGKGQVIKGLRRHARRRVGIVEYKYVHYFVRLEEGKPPEHYYFPYPKKPDEQLKDWVEKMRKRKIYNSL
ncbi:unnamed protein product [Callosobruchus maculatus]|uniref:Large ribosomal subunit protein uL22m n=1 Tax=Callosobruchus maculatus TaxID=64391 RepID=A0A653C1L2_CALMS|nr:unnamed protein product [Callosobruchus maculatus]